MLTFIICLSLLVFAYFGYGKRLERIAKIDPNATVPSNSMFDGVDFLPLPRWKTFLIQLLNIAGIGPIFGAILGACFGPVCFLWITLGGIFIGAMHDFFSGVISLRNHGKNMPAIIGKYQNNGVKILIYIIISILLLLTGVVFMKTPASLLSNVVPTVHYWVWVLFICIYYFVATFLPLDKIVARIYPFFGLFFLLMAVILLVVIFTQDFTIPELDFKNYHYQKLPIFPTLFISIACGAISGFHSTQSPLMARCLNNEKECKLVFFESMIMESIIALVWAAIALAFFGGPEGLNDVIAGGKDATWVINRILSTTIGQVGAIFAIFGVVIAPISTGDTALRSLRIIISEALHIEQTSTGKRLIVSLIIFACAASLLFIDFNVLWRYFSWSNQFIASIMLWTIYSYLHKHKANYWVALLPAIFMTYVCSSFVFISDQFIGLGTTIWAYGAAGVITILSTLMFLHFVHYKETQVNQYKQQHGLTK